MLNEISKNNQKSWYNYYKLTDLQLLETSIDIVKKILRIQHNNHQ